MALNRAWNKDWQQIKRPSETRSGRMRLDRQQHIRKMRLETRQRINKTMQSRRMQAMKLNMAKKGRITASLRSYQPTDTSRSRDTGLRQQAVSTASASVFQRQFQKTREAARGLNNLTNKPQGNKAATKAAVVTKGEAQNQPQFTFAQAPARNVPQRSGDADRTPKMPKVRSKSRGGRKAKGRHAKKVKAKVADGIKQKAQPAKLGLPKGARAEATAVVKPQPQLPGGDKSDKKTDDKKKSSLKPNVGGVKSRQLGKVLDGQGGHLEAGVDLAGGGSDQNDAIVQSDAPKRTPLTETDPGRKAYCDVTPQQEQVIAYFSIWKSQVLKQKLVKIAEFNSDLDHNLAKIIVTSDNKDAVGQVMRGARLPVNSDGGFRA